MIVKYQGLSQALRPPLKLVYCLNGQDAYLLNDAARRIKLAWKQQGECDECVIDLTTKDDWNRLENEAFSYSLFSDLMLIDARLDKKSMDADGKKTLKRILHTKNPRCLIILRLPNVPTKSLQTLTDHEQIALVQSYPFTPVELRRFITSELNSKCIAYEQDVPTLIQQYTQGNLLASVQSIERISIMHTEATTITAEQVTALLHDQCDFQLYELTDACLNHNLEKAIHILRQAYQNKTEPTLLLWLLTQEIRLLLQLDRLRTQSVALTAACKQLNIWPQRAATYEAARLRIGTQTLHTLLLMCQSLDERIKARHGALIWQELEQLALKF